MTVTTAFKVVFYGGMDIPANDNALKRLSLWQLEILLRRLQIKRTFFPGLHFARIGWVLDRVNVEINKRFWKGERP